MISVEEVKKLAILSRIEVSGEEVEKLRKDLERILDYVGQLKEVELSEKRKAKSEKDFGNINIMREDANPHTPLESLGYFKVKKIIDYDA